ncbi:histidine phosphatase family protein [Aliihoeflea aestuarii]|jgi:phosphohistidine phosphatase SixA|uniref:histidine phosphatase family protein n=1 Tax=Aliihoeflea aestuarii TaxID=453840 RepID=UPI002091FD4F|nr:histidine phosphatase family protein [Aliihoeflea aestuarii]MCO6391995.1 histidine phosphatase family protein [Aliihoeflea aestuarii]
MYRTLIITILSFALALPAAATEAGWALLRNGGQVVLLNHANAPGATEPAAFDIESCRTQRNLSERGRQQARRIGALFAARAAPVEEIFSSRYCRTRDTAELAFGASLVETVDWLDPFDADGEEADARRQRLIEEIEAYTGSGILVMVTHDSYVDAVLGTRPREGEAIIVTAHDGALQTVGRIVFN